MDDRIPTPADEVDLRDLTIDDVRRVNNPVLQKALVAAKERLADEFSNASHIQHNQHESHTNTI